MKDIAELVRQAQAGDDAAFEELVGNTLDGAYRFVRSLGADAEDAEDAVQDGYVRAWRALGTFDATKPFTPWLFQIVKRSFYDLHRSRRKVPTLQSDASEGDLLHSVPDPEPLPDAVFEQEATRARVRIAFGSMSVKDRSILMLRYDEGFSFEEIAQALEMPAATVRSIHHRALAKLREELTDLL